MSEESESKKRRLENAIKIERFVSCLDISLSNCNKSHIMQIIEINLLSPSLPRSQKMCEYLCKTKDTYIFAHQHFGMMMMKVVI